MPSEQQKGTSSNFANFLMELAIHVGMEVSDDIGRMWAADYLAQDNQAWEPQYPRKPRDNKDNQTKSKYASAKKAYEDNFAT